MDTLKVDWDSQDFDTYINIVESRIKRLVEFNVKFTSCLVYKTTRGFHIYYTTYKKDYDLKDVIILELILGNDCMRSIYTYVEQVDILFNYKRGIKNRTFNNDATNKLNNVIHNANRINNDYINIYV